VSYCHQSWRGKSGQVWATAQGNTNISSMLICLEGTDMSKLPGSSDLQRAQLRNIEIAKYYRQVMRLRQLVQQAERAAPALISESPPSGSTIKPQPSA
jgi:hypothetical protein